MLVGPVIVRELREQSRRPMTHLLRLLGVGAVLLLAFQVIAVPLRGAGRTGILGPGGIVLPPNPSGWMYALEMGLHGFENRGGALFQMLNLALLGGIWLFAPLLTADSLSRERREGTLGLLFLTPLRARDIVAAKLGANFLRGATVLLAAFPVLAIPMLLGGVSWNTVAHAALMDLGALVLALSAGLLASVLFQGPRMVLFGALFLSLFSGLAWAVAWTVVEVATGSAGVPGSTLLDTLGHVFLRRVNRVVTTGRAVAGDLPGAIATTSIITGGNRIGPVLGGLGLLGVGLTLGYFVFLVACAHVARVQREGRPPGVGKAAAEWLERPRYFATHLSRFRAFTLRREPVLWTEFRSWRLRIGVWLMPLALLPWLLEWVSVAAFGQAERFELPVWVLMGMMSLAAASCLGVERSSGVLELLLTAPRGVAHVVRGKLLALGIQSVPSAALLLIVAAALFVGAGMTSGRGEAGWECLAALVVSLTGRLLLVSAAGAYFSVRFQGYLPALFATLGTGVVHEIARLYWIGAPQVRSLQLGTAHITVLDPTGWFAAMGGWVWVSYGVAAVFLALLVRDLQRRRFAAR